MYPLLKTKEIESENSNIVFYKAADGSILLGVNLEEETVWLSQTQMGKLFDRGLPAINEHIKNIYKEEELEENPTIRKFRIVQKEGSRNVKREVLYYNLDVIISVGYRVKSKRGTQFRIWANKILKDHLIQGYSINEKRLEETQKELKFLRTGIQIVSRAIEDKANEEGYEYLNQFAKGLTLLDDYDHESLDAKGLSHREAIYPKRNDYQGLIDQMKNEFNSDIFGLEKDQSFESAIAQISKGFGELDFYDSIEEKAAMLLYLVVKNHAFTDGNKKNCCCLFSDVP